MIDVAPTNRPPQPQAACRPGPGLRQENFRPVLRRGAGDPGNAYCHAMQSFDGCLYLGFTRHTLCGSTPYSRGREMAIWPVQVPDIPWEVDWRAQIWRFDPRTGELRNVHVSPMAVGDRGFEVPRQIGFREMRVFKGRSDRTPALYAISWGSHMGPGPHVLRCADSSHFEETPIEEPSLFGRKTLRPLAVCRDKLFTATAGQVGGSDADQRAGMALVSEDPAAGRWSPASEVNFGSPRNVTIFEMENFDGWLYATTMNPYDGMELWRTDAEGRPPYRWQRVLDRGAGRGKLNELGASLCPFKGALYVGTAIYNCGYDRTYNVGPARPEILRVWPDGSWDLLVGQARHTDQGLKVPLSGLGPGFESFFCGYIWRLCEHEGWLYAGTCAWSPWLPFADTSRWRPDARAQLTPELRDRYVEEHGGFELWRTRDGENWEPVTRNGFDNRYNCGARTMVSTPHGLFVGTANQFGPKVAVRRAAGWRYEYNDRTGAEVWLGTRAAPGPLVRIAPCEAIPSAPPRPALVVRTDPPDADLMDEFYDHSGWRHVGYWRPGVKNTRAAGENLIEELLALARPDETRREPRIPGEETLQAWAASRPQRPWERCEAVRPPRPVRRDVLDLGCGAGASTRYLLKHFEGAGIVGIPWTRRDRRLCRHRAGDGLTFIRGRPPRLPVGRQAFDLVLCVEGATACGQREILFARVLDALRPGGFFLCADYVGSSTDEPDWADPEAYRRALERIGFADVRVLDATDRCATPFREQLMLFTWTLAVRGEDEETIRQAQQSAPNGGEPIATYLLAAATKGAGP